MTFLEYLTKNKNLVNLVSEAIINQQQGNRTKIEVIYDDSKVRTIPYSGFGAGGCVIPAKYILKINNKISKSVKGEVPFCPGYAPPVLKENIHRDYFKKVDKLGIKVKWRRKKD